MTQPVTWPEKARCAIMMTFDLDGESPWIHRDPALAERPLHMSMGAYGPKTGMPRILQLLDRYQKILGKKDVWWPKPAELARFWLEQSQSRTAR